jgi:hypothetical protein
VRLCIPPTIFPYLGGLWDHTVLVTSPTGLCWQVQAVIYLTDHVAVCVCVPLTFSFYTWSMSYQRKVGDSFFPELLVYLCDHLSVISLCMVCICVYTCVFLCLCIWTERQNECVAPGRICRTVWMFPEIECVRLSVCACGNIARQSKSNMTFNTARKYCCLNSGNYSLKRRETDLHECSIIFCNLGANCYLLILVSFTETNPCELHFHVT